MNAAPRACFIGVTGHRLNQLSEADLPAIRATIGDVMAACERALPATEEWTLVSALAEGTDRLAAGEALARGWRLEVILPFSRNRYIQDFETEASRGEFNAFCAMAADVSVAPDNDGKGDGYVAVGRETVRRADMLVAVWKGAAPAGPGGTAHVISDMLASGGAVVWIDPAGGLATNLLSPTESSAPGTSRAAIAAALSSVFGSVPWPDTLP